MRGDLDWIVMKALEKDRTRRYDTASKFAEDVQRYLQDEPVTACPPSAAYRFGKFARRNKPLIATTMAIAAALVIGAGVAIWQALVATYERDRAIAAEERLVDEIERANLERDRAIAAESDAQESLAKVKQLTRETLRRIERFTREGTEWLSIDEATKLMRVGQLDTGISVADAYFDVIVREVTNNPRWEALKPLYVELRANQPEQDARMSARGRRFNGKESFGVVPGLYFDGVPPWTFEVLAACEALETDGVESAMNLFSCTEGGGVAFCSVNQGWWAFWVGVGGRSGYVRPKARESIPVGLRQHIAGVWDGHEASLFVDGVLQERKPAPANQVQLALTAMPFYIGADPAGGYDVRELFNGTIESIRFSRAILYGADFTPPSELTDVEGTVALFDLRYDEGDYAFDRSGNGNHAILVNTEVVPIDDR